MEGEAVTPRIYWPSPTPFCRRLPMLNRTFRRSRDAYDVIVGLRNFPIVEKLLAATGGSGQVYGAGSGGKMDIRDADGSSADSKHSDDKENRGNSATLAIGDLVADHGNMVRVRRRP